jgi:hypothetical protein
MQGRQPFDDATALKVIRKRMSKPPYKVIELLGVVGVSQRPLRKLNHCRNRAIANFRQHDRLANLRHQSVERVSRDAYG